MKLNKSSLLIAAAVLAASLMTACENEQDEQTRLDAMVKNAAARHESCDDMRATNTERDNNISRLEAEILFGEDPDAARAERNRWETKGYPRQWVGDCYFDAKEHSEWVDSQKKIFCEKFPKNQKYCGK